MKQNIIIAFGRRERRFERLLRLTALLVDELSTDLMLVCQMADRLRARKDLDADSLANVRG